MTRRTLCAILLLACALLQGCGDAPKSGDGGPAAVAPSGSSRTIATLGDSIVAGSPLWDPDPDVRAGFERVDEDSQWQRSVEAAGDAKLRNCGVWGERTDEIAARYARCTKGADAVVIQGGINDIVQGRDIDDATRDIACLLERARGDGLDAALVEVLPWNNGFPQAATSIRRLNEQLHELADTAGVPILPFHEELDDPRHPGLMPRSLTEDGNHPNVAGYARLGTRAWREPTKVAESVADRCDA